MKNCGIKHGRNFRKVRVTLNDLSSASDEVLRISAWDISTLDSW